MAHSALAIANEFLRLRNKSFHPVQMYIQKLVFNANGWNLAINDDPLVDEQAQAWDNGPVYRSIWNHIRDYGYGRETCELLNPNSGRPYEALLTKAEKGVILETWNKYGSFSADELSQMSHSSGSPWSVAYFSKGRNAGISDRDAKAYYTRLAMAGRG